MVAVPDLRGLLREIGSMDLRWIAAAVALEIGSCLAFVVVFRLFFADVPAGPARGMAWSVMASGVLLPGGGVGGLAMGGWLLRLGGMPISTIVQRSSGLFLLTSAVNVVVLGVAGLLLLLRPGYGPGSSVPLAVVPAVVAAVVLAAVWVLPGLVARRRAPGGWAADLVAGIELAKLPLRRPGWRLAGAAGYLLFDIAVLWAAFAALDVYPPVAAIVAGYVVGLLANVVPVPGGVGVVDAGLVAALVLYGAPAESSAAAVLVYHAIAFWVPGLGGSLAYLRLRGRSTGAGRPVPLAGPVVMGQVTS